MSVLKPDPLSRLDRVAVLIVSNAISRHSRERAENELVNRRVSPWDDPNRRPSHTDKRRTCPANCRPIRFMPFYAPKLPRRGFNPSLSGDLVWPHESGKTCGKCRSNDTASQ